MEETNTPIGRSAMKTWEKGLNVPPYSVYECRIYTVSQTDESLNIFSNMNYGVTFWLFNICMDMYIGL